MYKTMDGKDYKKQRQQEEDKKLNWRAILKELKSILLRVKID